jgi:hypothetical protein
MRNFIILGAAVLLTACGSSEKPEPVRQVNNRSCSENMYELGEMIQNMHYLGYSRRSAMDTLVQNYGPSMNSLSDFTAVVWAMPKGHWAKGEVGGQLRDEAIRQGCI